MIGSNDLYLVMLQFQHDPCHENNQELVGVLSNGNVLMMSNINVDGLCSSADSGTLAQILKVAKFSNFKLSLDSNGVRKAVLIPFDPNHPVDTLQIIVLDTKYQLRSFIMDLSVTQPDGGFVGQSLSFVGLVCSFHLLVLAQQYYVVGLQTKGSIVIANLNTLNSIAEYHIGQKLDGIVSVKVVSVNESFHGISLAVKSTAAKAIYLQTILVSNLPSQATAFVIPHGHEVITNTNVAMGNIFSNGLPLGTLDRVLTLGQKELGIYSLGSVSQLLFREILQVSFSATVNLQALENSNISFGMILGTFVHIFCSSSQHRNDGLLQSLLRACSKRRFASEIIQLASLLLDNNSLEDTLTEQLLTECQVMSL